MLLSPNTGDNRVHPRTPGVRETHDRPHLHRPRRLRRILHRRRTRHGLRSHLDDPAPRRGLVPRACLRLGAPREARHRRRLRGSPCPLRQCRLGRRTPHRPSRCRRGVCRRHRPVEPLHQGGAALHRDPALHPRRLHRHPLRHGPCTSPQARDPRQPPDDPARSRGRIRRRDRRRRLGAGDYTHAPR